MTTIQQLPIAPTLSGQDKVLISQNGATTTATIGQLLADTQPIVKIATNTLLGRASILPGGPEALGIGPGLVLQSGTLDVNTVTFSPSSNAALSGRPTAPTPPAGDASAAIATTAFVANATSAAMPVMGAGLQRAGKTLSVNLAGIDTSSAVVRTAPGVVRALASLIADEPNARDYGAAGDGISDDTAAIQAFSAAGGGLVPPGTYNTTLNAASFINGRIQGPGRVSDGSSYLRAPSITAMVSKPAGSASESSIESAFNGDFSRSQLAFEHRVMDSNSGHTIGVPGPNSYLYSPQTSAIYGYVLNSSGYNGTTGDNSSRTGMAASRIKVDQYGQGDMIAYNATGLVASTLPGATHFFANPAVRLFSGDLQAGADGTYLNPVELVINDQGHDVAGGGAVVKLNRTNNTGQLAASWFGYRAQSIGSKPVDAHFTASGAARVSLDLVGATSPVKGAVAIKANDRVYLNSSNPGPDQLPSTLVTGGEWLEYDATKGAQFVVSGSPVAQFRASGANLAATPPVGDNSVAIATTGFVKNQGYLPRGATHLFSAVDYGAPFDGIGDDSPGIQAAIAAAQNSGGGAVILPGRKGILKTGLVIDHPAVCIRGTGATTIDDYSAQTYLSGRAGTRLVWSGPLGGTMLTLQLNSSLNGSAVQLKGCDIEAILWDCNGAVNGVGAVIGGAATAVAAFDTWDSRHHIYFMSPTSIGVRYERCQGVVSYVYGGCFAVPSASGLQLAGTARGANWGNSSLNLFPVVRIGIVNGDGLVFHETDHNLMQQVDIVRSTGGNGRGVIFAGARDQPANGPLNAYCAYQNRIHYCNTNGSPIVAEGSNTAGVIAPSYGNMIDWLDRSNGTPLPSVGTGASIFYSDDSGFTYSPLIVSPLFANQATQLNSGNLQAQLNGETVPIWNSGASHIRLYASDYQTIWRMGTNASTGNFELSPDRQNASQVEVAITNGASLHVDGLIESYGIGKFNNIAVASPSDSHSTTITNNVSGGYLNPLAQVGDTVFSFTGGTQNTGALLLGPWSTSGYGLRLASDGTATINGQPVWHAGNLTNLGQLSNSPGFLTAATQPIASAGVAGAVKVGGGLSVATDGTLAAVIATLTALRAVPWAPLADGATLSVAAYAGRGDGGGGVFTWVANSTLTDNGGTVINPNGHSGAGRWLRQISLGRVTPQMFGAKGDGVTNDTAAFNAALAVGRVTVPYGTYSVSNLAMTNGCEIEGGAGLGYSGDMAANTVVRPVLVAASGAVSILNVTGIKDFSVSGLFLDGNNTGCDGISAGSTQMTLNRVTVVRCNNGLGSTTATDVYTHIATITDCEFANCTYGVTNLIDSAMLAGAVSACQYGLWLSSGAAANNFVAVRYEWCTQHNIHIFQAQKNQFVGGLVDRGYVAGAYLAGASDIHFVGVQFSRNGRNNDATWLGNSHIVLDSNNASIAVTNPIWTTGIDDNGTGALTPQYGITYNNSNDRITITSGDGGGFVVGFARGNEPTNYVLRDVSGAGDSIVTAARPYLRGGTAAHTVQTRTTSNITAGQTSTIAMGQSAMTAGYTAYSRELKLYAVDFSTGASYGARFNLTFYYDTAAHLPSVSSAYGEIGGSGLFQFSTTAGTLRLSITGLNTNGSTFTLNITNGSSNGNYGVWAELL